ncbi:hypothetical protein HMPREF9318_00292 [Streptococcus urinalis FB127-CNA-2]|uniref:ABC transporter, ATP-binding protein n=1 Tax=Streptococcus urinalis 2285-97 TaxID=764291 RepID=G5KFN2_9STRE|nr:ATP-binding cassette domain-containing protein [Streptococcus urinalis]EHJ57549.1 ABC transporter, ATP-binding protein [Streptococcus urinalis 2285-97]EKS22094.1 hypothetical protein HMPREF9318_00292 [Streptococcus urinalis FB127-CNA-2]VEF31906.1 ABC transporter ATP-binding protein [Streptococcus urinalis]
MFIDSLNGMYDLVQFHWELRRFSEILQKSQKVNHSERDLSTIHYIQQVITYFCLAISLLVFSIVVLIGINTGHINLENGIILVIVFTSSFAPFLELSRLPLGLKKALNAAEHILKIVEEVMPIKKGHHQLDQMKSIIFEDVTFSYPNRSRDVIRNLNLIVEKPIIIGIKGQSGAGKTTIMKLIMRWYDKQIGNLYLNDFEIETLDPRKLQNKIAFVPQVPKLFHQTLRENLVFANNKISDQAIFEMASDLDLTDKLLSLPHGLDTVLDGKIVFSDGEKQRLEILRALIKDADCYLFDEPTANLDSLNEARFLKVVNKYCKGIVIIISHRASTLSVADKILTLNQNKLEEVIRENEQIES